MEFRAGMAKPHAPAIGGRDDSSVLLSAAFCNCIVKPDGGSSRRCFHVIKPHVDVALSVSANIRGDIRPSTGEKSQRELREFHIEVFDPGAVATHIQYVEIIDIDVIPAIESLARPELGVRVALDDVSRLSKGFPEPELVVAYSAGKIGIIA